MSTLTPAATAAQVSAAAWQPTALVLPSSLSYQQWSDLVGTLETMRRGHPWWYGDALNYGEAAYGERYTAALSATGNALQTLMNYAWVASRIPPEARREGLSWSAHRAVASLEAEQRDRILDEAEERGWGKQEVEEAVRALKRAVPTPKGTRNLSPGRDSESAEPHPGKPAEDVGLPAETPAAEPAGAPDFDLGAELERADREIRELQSLVESLQADDRAAEIARWQRKYSQLEGRLQQAIAEGNEAKRQAARQGKLLREIRSVLGVERNGEIVPALMDSYQARRVA